MTYLSEVFLSTSTTKNTILFPYTILLIKFQNFLINTHIPQIMLTLFISYIILQSSFLMLTHAVNGAVGSNGLASNYQLFLESKNWVDAELFCQEKGGHLISIHDETTNLQITNHLLTTLPSNIEYSWIGFNQVDQTWTDNTPHDYTSSLDQNPQGACTTIWAAPNSLPQNRGYWMGPPCDNTYPFMCNIPSTPTSECNHVNGFVTNQCRSDSSGESFKQVCIDENTTEYRHYSGLNCNESQLTSSSQNECTADINCDCTTTDETACNIGDITVTECSPIFQQVHTILLDKCFINGESDSHSYHCNDNGAFVWQSYDNSNCQLSDGYTEEIFPTSCESGEYIAITCGISIDRITSDCVGNEIERESVIIDECHTETFDNSPNEISKYFCDDNNELGIKFYDAAITDNCDGESKVEYILDSAGQCKDGFIFSSTCGGFIPVETMDNIQRITLDCAGNIQKSENVTTNYCELESFPNGPSRPYEYFCNENKELGLKYYIRGSGNCDGNVELETILDSNNECIDGNVFDSTCHEISKCTANQFECDNKCIPNDWICDAIQDCNDNSDEINCPSPTPFPTEKEKTVKPTSAPAVECTNNEFKCENDNICIPNYWICDAIQDCNDNSDEINCPSPTPFPTEKEKTVKPTSAPAVECTNNEFKCENDNICIPNYWICDSIQDCSDNSDEINCPSTTPFPAVECTDEEFKCENDNKCIPNYWICDSIQDCSDNSDEINCPSTTPFPAVECTDEEFKCENDNKCIPNYWICDSIQDCSDNSDEINCPSHSPFPTVKPTNAPVVSRLCIEELKDFNIGAIFEFNGGCDEHFSALVFEDKSGDMYYSDCVKKCNEMSECKSFVFHKEQNWCNIYSVICSDNGDTDWFMFTPINNAEVMCNSNN
eukprot:424209_1